MTTASGAGRLPGGEGSPLFTLALFALVLAVVFTVALWVGRAVGPAPATHRPAPAADRESPSHTGGTHP